MIALCLGWLLIERTADLWGLKSLQAGVAHAYGIQRVIRKQVESTAVLATEEDVVRALGDVDTIEELTCGRVDKDLARGKINVCLLYTSRCV